MSVIFENIPDTAAVVAAVASLIMLYLLYKMSPTAKAGFEEGAFRQWARTTRRDPLYAHGHTSGSV